MGQLTQTTEEVQTSLDGVYAGLHVHDAQGGSQLIPNSGYTKTTAWTDANPSSNATSDIANNKLVLSETGVYQVTVDISFSVVFTDEEATWKGAVFADGDEQHQIHWQVKLKDTQQNDAVSVSCSGFLTITESTDIDFRISQSDSTDRNMLLRYGNFLAVRIGG